MLEDEAQKMYAKKVWNPLMHWWRILKDETK
jgi:hypothetical protein